VDDGRVEGRAYLEKYIADRLAAGQGQPPEGRRLSLDLSEIRGVAIGLVAAGALAQEEMERILADVEQELERLGRLTRIEARMAAEGRGSPAHWAPVSVEARQQLVLQHSLERAQRPEPVVTAAQLREVISLAGRTLTLGAATGTLISLERWSTMFVLRLAHADPHADDLRSLDRMQARQKRWRGWDDAGTQYRYRGGSGSLARRGRLSMENVVLEPGAPDEARTLTLAFDHETETERLTVALGTGTTTV
jgi:hypothetical protein